jgi:predicted alpha/beta hydrolase family esterase
VYAFTYNSWKWSFHDLLEQLDRRVDGVAGIFDRKRVVLVGHSLGGLLSRAYVECSSQAGKIQAVVTLGAPHQGSKLAALGLGSLAQSLLYRGPLIDRLEKEARETDVPRLAIHSPVDNMVLPNEALQAPHGGWEHHESRPVGHVGMLYHKPTANLVIDYLLRHSAVANGVKVP